MRLVDIQTAFWLKPIQCEVHIQPMIDKTTIIYDMCFFHKYVLVQSIFIESVFFSWKAIKMPLEDFMLCRH